MLSEVLLRRTRPQVAALLVLVLCMPPTALALENQETPPSDRVATLGGVVPFAGWTCPGDGGHHGVITMSVDGGPKDVIGSRISRDDTAAACNNDGKNGYVALRNLGLDGPGEHMVVFYEDGVEFAAATYRVVEYGSPFLTGVARTTVVRDFPFEGQSAVLRWDQGLQAFTASEFCEGEACDCAVLDGARCTQSGELPEIWARLCNYCDYSLIVDAARVSCSTGTGDLTGLGGLLITPGQCRRIPGDEDVLSPSDDATECADATVFADPIELAVDLSDGATIAAETSCCWTTAADCEADGQCCSGVCTGEGSCAVPAPTPPPTPAPTPAPTPLCGNGILDGSEECDSVVSGGETCDSLGFGLGLLSCGTDCRLDTSECGCTGAGGTEIAGACWFEGARGQSCTEACSLVAGSYDAATNTYAGAGAPDASGCVLVSTTLHPAISSFFPGGDAVTCAEGCTVAEIYTLPTPTTFYGRCIGGPTTPEGSNTLLRRYCACQ